MDTEYAGELRHTVIVGPSGSPNAKHVLYQDLRKTVFEAKDIAIFRSPTGRLNDVCLNGGAALIQDDISSNPLHSLSSRRCAILSTFDLPRVRFKTPDADLWRNLRQSQYWTKDVWILPIHRPGHWVFCVIALKTHQIFLFDSLAAQHPWRRDVKEIVCLMTRMILLANRNGHALHVIPEGWTACPILVSQSSSLQNFRLMFDYRYILCRQTHMTVGFGCSHPLPLYFAAIMPLVCQRQICQCTVDTFMIESVPYPQPLER